jgi:hypothetical protein
VGDPDDEWDVNERSDKTYLFLGVRYRGAVLPQAFINLFISGGATLFTNAAGLELDIRTDGFSLIPNITYQSYSTGNLLFLQQNTPESDPGNWSEVNSGLKVLFAGTDFIWSTKIAKNFDFEYGFGVGIGVVFGTLIQDWVTPVPAGTAGSLSGTSVDSKYTGAAVQGHDGQTSFVPCASLTSGPGCALADHAGDTIGKVNGYQEPHGFNPVPSAWFNVSIPQIGLRFKPIKSIESRISVAFNIPNGVVFGISGNYGLEDALKK